MSDAIADPHPGVDAFIERAKAWQSEFRCLREVLRTCGLQEALKWGSPCYTVDGHNVVIFNAFKTNCVLGFFKGVLLPDPMGWLEAPGENSQSARMMRFHNLEELQTRLPHIPQYLADAIAVERSGQKVHFKKPDDFEWPAELVMTFAADPAFQAAFQALSPGRQRAYLLHFSQAKQSTTRQARIDKHRPRILSGLGILDLAKSKFQT